MKKTVALLLLISILAISSMMGQERWSSKHVFYGKNGKLEYKPDSLGNTIPDFSHVGYQYGDVPLPNVPVEVVISPGEGDDLTTIQNAIESLYNQPLDENGFRGAVLLSAGTYEVSGIIRINQSGIILRGEGEHEQGTRIIATGQDVRPLIELGGDGGLDIVGTSAVNIIEPYVPVGRQFVVVDNISNFNAGDKITIFRPGTDEWISDIKMDQIAPDGEELNQWTPGSYSFHFERDITHINGDTIFFRNPIVMAMEDKYGSGLVYKASFNRIKNIGIEYLLLESEYDDDDDDTHAWHAIMIEAVEHSWVRNVTAKYFGYSCVNLQSSSRHITVTDSKQLEPKSRIAGGNRYSFNSNGQQNLIINCHTTEGRHDYVNGSRVKGPNVFTNSTAASTLGDIGPHHRWAMGSLFDRIISDGPINVQDRGASGTGHGWAGANQVFWGCEGSSSIVQNPWASAYNYSIGFIGEKRAGVFPDRPDGIWEGHNLQGLMPSSLYLAQLNDRLSDTIFFSVLPYLEQENDSVFLMSFNFAPNALHAADVNKYTFGGNSGLAENFHQLEVVDTNTVRITFTMNGADFLPPLSRLNITIDGITSAQGLALNGLKTAWYNEPDTRPVVSASYQEVTNDPGQFVIASTSKDGKLWLIRGGLPAETIEQLDSIVAEGLGKVINAPVANAQYPVFTQGLPPGVYYFFSSDAKGRISRQSANIIYIRQGTTTSVWETEGSEFLIATLKNGIRIIPENFTGHYSAEIIDTNGRLVAAKNNISGDYQLNTLNKSGMHIIRIISEHGVLVKKVMLHP
jgi:hypothetical protein